MSRYISEELRRFVRERAAGRCEYCRIPASAIFKHHIEHIFPLKHGGQTQIENLALACPFCNEQKGTDIGTLDFETDGEFARFFNPRTQIWTEHFQIETDGEIFALTAEARVTIKMLKFNNVERIEERRELIEAEIY